MSGQSVHDLRQQNAALVAERDRLREDKREAARLLEQIVAHKGHDGDVRDCIEDIFDAAYTALRLLVGEPG